MSNGIDEITRELRDRAPDMLRFLERRDSAARLLEELPSQFSPVDLVAPDGAQRIWELIGLYHLYVGRVHEALALLWRLYEQLLIAQESAGWIHKGMPLVWISECYARLAYQVHAKRYLMLTLCEDAIRGEGTVSPDDSGIYFRLVWGSGLPEAELRRYAQEFAELARKAPSDALFPEALLQQLDQGWLTEFPSPQEAAVYVINRAWARNLRGRLGDRSGNTLELLAEYLLSCMPGCRTKRRQRSESTDYDIICSMEGFDVDFRSELGRYFVCECKDWNEPADFTTMAKFCRVLDSTKARFGILFSRRGISGAGRSINAEREQLKVFQDRGIVIVVINSEDLAAVSNGANLNRLLRQRYEAIRLDIRDAAGNG
jgi:hypothetical protein